MPAVPFTFKFGQLSRGQEGVQTAVNEKTNEEFSVSSGFFEVVVKRTRAPKEKEKTSKTVKA